ncbi:calcium-binding protein [Paracoccus aminovorans]|uniref:calcium-binding protein n=1 Tax=Paracoccus aminovorans TaxID=34004 RepID=UPI002B25AADF|nr:calcium-binding protein [Paracoccus aminovorans]
MAVINGTTGSDRLNGTVGRDTIRGLEGRDTINPGRGSDYAHGGPGADVLIWNQDPNSRGNVDTYIGGSAGENYEADIYGSLAGGDRLHLYGARGFRVTFTSSENGFVLDAFGNRLNFSGFERLQTGAGNDSIDGSRGLLNAARGAGSSFTPVHGLTVNSGAGNDTIRGTNGSDVIDPGPGNDRVFGGGGTDLLMPSQGNDYGHAGAGDDNVRWGNNGSMGPIYNIGRDTLVGGAGHDLLNVWATGSGENSVGAHVVFTTNSSGRASFPQANGTLVFSEFEQFWTHEGRDTVSAANATIGADGKGIFFNTRWGDDRLTGSAGRDTLEGGQGADTIDGGRGNDLISMVDDVHSGRVIPDSQRDVLIIRDGAGADTIRGFQIHDGGGIASDRLSVATLHDRGGHLVDVNDVTVTARGNGALLSFPKGESILLEGVSAASLTRAMLIKLGIPANSAQAAEVASAKVMTAQADPAAASATAAEADDGGARTLATDHFSWRFPAAEPVPHPDQHHGGLAAIISDMVGTYREMAANPGCDHAELPHVLAQIFDWN